MCLVQVLALPPFVQRNRLYYAFRTTMRSAGMDRWRVAETCVQSWARQHYRDTADADVGQATLKAAFYTAPWAGARSLGGAAAKCGEIDFRLHAEVASECEDGETVSDRLAAFLADVCDRGEW